MLIPASSAAVYTGPVFVTGTAEITVGFFSPSTYGYSEFTIGSLNSDSLLTIDGEAIELAWATSNGTDNKLGLTVPTGNNQMEKLLDWVFRYSQIRSTTSDWFVNIADYYTSGSNSFRIDTTTGTQWDAADNNTTKTLEWVV